MKKKCMDIGHSYGNWYYQYLDEKRCQYVRVCQNCDYISVDRVADHEIEVTHNRNNCTRFRTCKYCKTTISKTKEHHWETEYFSDTKRKTTCSQCGENFTENLEVTPCPSPYCENGIDYKYYITSAAPETCSACGGTGEISEWR
jgi:hypothetical protein